MASPATRFTRTNTARLTGPAGRAEAFFWDAALPGFGLRACASGRPLWIAQHREGTGRTRRATFGDAGTVGLDDARITARTLLSKVALGADPQAEKQAARKAVRVSALIDVYRADAKSRTKPRSFAEVKRHFRAHARPLHQHAEALAGRADVVRALDGIARESGPVASRVRSTLSALRSGLIGGENPVAHVPKPGAETPRERTLSDAELGLTGQAAGGEHDHDRIVRLLMLTGARREEVAGMAWAEIAGAVWTLLRARSKNGMPHEVPLAPLALDQLPPAREGRPLVFGEGEGGFSGWSRCKARLDGRVLALRGARQPADEAVPGWTLHDPRRTGATWLSESGTDRHVLEAVLNHVSGAAKRGVAWRAPTIKRSTGNRNARRSPGGRRTCES